MAKILLVEDDTDLANVIRIALSAKGHTVKICADGAEAVSFLRIYKYDLVILDWMLPHLSGVEILNEYRTSAGKCAVLMLTAKSELDDKETALDLGADDYLTKPFHTRELLARVRALLRRPHLLMQTMLQAGDVELDPSSCTVTKLGKELHLRPKVYSLLEFLMRHQGQVFTAEALLERVWLDDSSASVDTVRTHIKLLRRSIGSEPSEAGDQSMIRNVRNRGYMLQPQPAPAPLD